MTGRFRGVTVSAAIFLLPFGAKAAVTYSNLGPGDTYDTATHAVSGAGSFLGAYQGIGMQFVAGSTVSLTSLELGFRHGFGANSYKFTLSQNVAGQPGAALETWAASAPAISGSLISLVSTGGPTLIAGKTYWVTAQPIANTAWGFWGWNNQGSIGTAYYQSSPSGTWSSLVGAPNGALRVSGSGAAPEPATIALTLTGLATGWKVRRRRR